MSIFILQKLMTDMLTSGINQVKTTFRHSRNIFSLTPFQIFSSPFGSKSSPQSKQDSWSGKKKRKVSSKININFDEDKVMRLNVPAPRLAVRTVFETQPWSWEEEDGKINYQIAMKLLEESENRKDLIIVDHQGFKPRIALAEAEGKHLSGREGDGVFLPDGGVARGKETLSTNNFRPTDFQNAMGKVRSFFDSLISFIVV